MFLDQQVSHSVEQLMSQGYPLYYVPLTVRDEVIYPASYRAFFGAPAFAVSLFLFICAPL
jgi:hypothetical protein